MNSTNLCIIHGSMFNICRQNENSNVNSGQSLQDSITGAYSHRRGNNKQPINQRMKPSWVVMGPVNDQTVPAPGDAKAMHIKTTSFHTITKTQHSSGSPKIPINLVNVILDLWTAQPEYSSFRVNGGMVTASCLSLKSQLNFTISVGSKNKQVYTVDHRTSFRHRIISDGAGVTSRA